MWEITIIANKKDYLYLFDMIDRLKNKYDKLVTAITLNSELLCSIAIDTADTREIEEIVYETILKIYKFEFFSERLKIFSQDKSFNSFIMTTMIYMDIREELNYIQSHYKLKDKIHIRSFFNFRMQKLINIWSDFIEYVNFNFKTDGQNVIYLDFLKFLVNNTNSQIDILYLDEIKNEMYLIDKNNRTISIISKSDEIGMLVDVIIYSPKKLVIKCSDTLSDKVIDLLQFIFDDRVSMML